MCFGIYLIIFYICWFKKFVLNIDFKIIMKLILINKNIKEVFNLIKVKLVKKKNIFLI